MITWPEALKDLGYEVLVRNGQLFLGQDLGTSEAEVADSFSVGNESPDSEKGQKIFYEIRTKFGK